jgi:delta-aminolevulinic acid dehydratase/porphobilinogen synthase
MNLKITDINNGDIVTVKSGFSFGPVEVGTVVDVDEEKNGHPIVIYSVSGEEKWVYVEQIVRVDHTTYYASKS